MATTLISNAWREDSLSYSQEGWKAHSRFLVLKETITGTNGAGTLYQAIADSIGIPARGVTHPYLNGTGELPLLKSDVIHAEPTVDNVNIAVDVDYAVLSGLTQEPSAAGDIAPALLTVASSLQTFQQATDINGLPIKVYYTKDNVIPSAAPAYFITPPGSVALPQTGALAPNITAKAQGQQPNLVLRFQRREQQQRSPLGLVGYYNTNAWNVSQLVTGPSSNFYKHTLLCTRVENTTRDEGVSWIVTYEFVAANIVLNSTGKDFIFKSPAVGININGDASGWDTGLYYVLPNGYSGTTGPGGSPANSPLGPGMIPSDALPTIFAVYGNYDFNTNLNLSA